MSSPWALVRSPCWTRCVLGRCLLRGVTSRESWPGSAGGGKPSGGGPGGGGGCLGGCSPTNPPWTRRGGGVGWAPPRGSRGGGGAGPRGGGAGQGIFEGWALTSAVIGEVTDDGAVTVMEGEDEVARLPVKLLTEGAPLRRLTGVPPEPAPILVIDSLPPPADLGATLLQLLASPNLCSRMPVIRRYDHMVGDSTVIEPGGDAAMLRVKATRVGLAVTTACNSRYCELDPNLGAQLAVAEAARNIIATGARPLAVTDCLNFANPDRPEVYWQMEETVAGLAQACDRLLH